jgi:hypothetical protein
VKPPTWLRCNSAYSNCLNASLCGIEPESRRNCSTQNNVAVSRIPPLIRVCLPRMILIAMLLPPVVHALVLKCAKRPCTADLIGVGASVNTTVAGVFANAAQPIIGFAMVGVSQLAGTTGATHAPGAVGDGVLIGILLLMSLPGIAGPPADEEQIDRSCVALTRERQHVAIVFGRERSRFKPATDRQRSKKRRGLQNTAGSLPPEPGTGFAARRSTSSMISKRWPGASLRKAFKSSRLSTVSLDGVPSLFCSAATNVGSFISHLRWETGMTHPGKREGLAQQVDTAAKEAERLGLTTATLILRMARLKIDRAEPDEVESMPRNNPRGKSN